MIPFISVNPKNSHKLDVGIALQKLYYKPEGYHRTVNKLYDASLEAGYDFTIDEVREWLERQALHQIHMPGPNYIPRASFNSIQIPNECHQSDIVYMPHDKVGTKIYKYCLCVVDVASRFKTVYPLTEINSSVVAKALNEIYNSRKCPLKWPKLFLSDKGPEFRKDCEELMKKHDVKIQKAESKRTMGIVERFNRTLAERLFRLQDASDLLLPITERDRKWVKNLPTIVKDINNSKTRLIGMSPAEAIKKKKVIAKSSQTRDGPMGFDEKRLTHNDSVRYLLEPGELEGGRKRAGDLVWSPQIYHIQESLVQKNQPILYWLSDEEGNGPSRSFVREEVLVIPHDTENPPNFILNH